MSRNIPRFSTAEATEHNGFVCIHCSRPVEGAVPGSEHRNHCPHCLWSSHVDIRSGDRRSTCRAPMEPVAIVVRRDGEWSLVHRCTSCGFLRSNRIAGDDNEMILLSIALRPLARPAFPLEKTAGFFAAQQE